MAYLGRVAHSAGDATFTSTYVAPVEMAVPAGAAILLVVDAMGNSPFVPVTVTDSQSNVWSVAVQQSAASDIDGQPTIAVCTLSTALTTSDTIIVNTASTPNNWVVEAHAFDDLDTVVSSAGNPGAFSKKLDSGLSGTASGRELVFVAFTYRYGSFPHTFTPSSGFTGETPLETANKNGVVVEWRYATDSESLAATMTPDGGMNWVGVGAVLGVEVPSQPNTGTASTSWAAVASAVGIAPPVAMATGTTSAPWGATASATGTAPPVVMATGTASVSWTVAGSATGTAPPVLISTGTASTPWSAATSAMGAAPTIPVATGTATTSWGAAISATGSAPLVPAASGTASMSWTATAVATGSAPTVAVSTGTALTIWSATVTATGTAPAVGAREGSAQIIWTATASATGTAPPVGQATGTATVPWSAAGSAMGIAPTIPVATGTATTVWMTTASATGSASTTVRNITIIAGPITGAWDGKIDGGAWTAHPATGSDWEAATPVGGWEPAEITG